MIYFSTWKYFLILKLFPGQSVTKTSVEHHGIFGSWFEIMNRDFCRVRPHRCIHSVCTGINFELVSARNFFNPGTTGLGIYEKNYYKITRSDRKSTSSLFLEKSWEHTLDLKLGKKIKKLFRYHDFYKNSRFFKNLKFSLNLSRAFKRKS